MATEDSGDAGRHGTGGPSAGAAGSFGGAQRYLGKLNLALTILLSLHILVVFNLIIYRHPLRVDLTVEKLHTLGNDTRERLKLVNEEIRVVVPIFFQENRPDHQIQREILGRGRALLDQYMVLQPRIRLEAELDLRRQDDAVRWMEMRTRHKIAENQVNRIFFFSGADDSQWQTVSVDDMAVYDRPASRFDPKPAKIHSFHAERAFTEALTRLIRREKKRIYFTRGLGEPSTRDRGADGLSLFREALVANGHEVDELTLLTAEHIPASCDLVILSSPSRVLHEDDRRKIQEYLLGGGRLLVTLGARNVGIEKVLDHWGIGVPAGQVLQKQTFFGGMQEWSNLVIARKFNPVHPITGGFSSLSFEVVGLHVRPLETRFRDRLSAEDVLTTGQPRKGEQQLAFLDSNRNRKLDEGERRGEITWGAAVHRKRPERPPPQYEHLPTRIAVFGDGTWLNNNWLERFSHRELALNTVRWLLGQEREITPSDKDPWRERRIAWSPEIQRFLFGVPIFLFPGIVLCFGMFVYFLRRN